MFHDKISEAQLEIKATVNVNTNDIASKANEDKDAIGKELEKAQKKRNAKLSNGVIITDELREELESAIISTQQAYVRAHHMFSRILNFLFFIDFSKEKFFLSIKNNSYFGIL